ncbi:MAG: DUF2807 domain-containing protein [Oscillospiraceae bacterium]|nr:DUF2807 domain-containing protein [Oscillospiraceae bacterium]
MKKRIFAISVMFVLAMTVLTGCVSIVFPENTIIIGKGEVQNYTYDVGIYNKVSLDGNFELIYKSGEYAPVIIEMQENLHEYVDASVQDGRLIVKSDVNLRIGNNKSPRVTITVPDLKEVSIFGAAIFENADLITGDGEEFILEIFGAGTVDVAVEVENLQINISGAGDITLNGSADNTRVSISGAGTLSALELQTREAEFTMSGAGDASISCSDNLKVRISGVGTLSYRGDPVVERNISGVGTINKVN